MDILIRLLYTSALLLVLTPSLRAQDADAQETTLPPAHIALVDGAATVERDGQSQAAVANAPFVPGDRLRTTTGRVEILFPDGTALDVDQYSGVDLQSPTLLRLVSGRIILVVAGASDPAAAARYQIDTPSASAQTDGAGEYRVAVLNGRTGLETELAVLRGSAALATERGSMPVGAGERTVARDNEAPSFPQAFNSARFDAFDQWSAAQRDQRTASASSSQYLPQDLQMYGGTLDRNGSWQYTAPHGYAWYPTVAADWQPYHHGSWSPYRPWGWTWIGVDVWAWPTHHYGRWGFARSRWFWVPGRSWGPAWVSWASAPGYVSWCPLGFDGGPVFGLSAGFGRRRGGWTVVPRTAFGHHGRIDRFAVPTHRIPVDASTFVAHHRAPIDVPRTAHVVKLPHDGGASRVAVPRWSDRDLPANGRLSIMGTRPPATVTPRADTSHNTREAVPRSPAASPSDFKQPLPEGFRGRAYNGAQHAQPRGSGAPGDRATPVDRATPGDRATPRDRVVPGVAAPAPHASPRQAYPVAAPPNRIYPHTAQPPQSAPRSAPPPAERPQRAEPVTAPPAPARVDRPSATPSRPATAEPRSAPPQTAVPRSGAPANAAPRSDGSASRPGGAASHSGGATSHSGGRGDGARRR